MDLKKRVGPEDKTQITEDSPPETISIHSAEVVEVHLTTLKAFADQNAIKYGIEIMAGFYHEQETATHFADTDENWSRLMNEFKTKEVK